MVTRQNQQGGAAVVTAVCALNAPRLLAGSVAGFAVQLVKLILPGTKCAGDVSGEVY